MSGGSHSSTPPSHPVPTSTRHIVQVSKAGFARWGRLRMGGYRGVGEGPRACLCRAVCLLHFAAASEYLLYSLLLNSLSLVCNTMMCSHRLGLLGAKGTG